MLDLLRHPRAPTAIALAVVAALVARVGPPAGDFANYYTAAALWWSGNAGPALYDYRWFTAQAAAHGFGDRLVGFAVLTPPSALLAVPLLPLSAHRAGQAWWLGQGVLLLALALLLGRSLRRPPWQPALVIVALWPAVQSHLYQGQFHLPAVVCLAAGFLAFRAQRAQAGLWWGLAVGLKVHAWPLLALLLLCRRWPAAAAAGGTLALGGALSVGLLGWPLHAAWLQDIAPAAAGGWFTDPWHPSLQSVHHTARRLFLPSPAGGPTWLDAPRLAAQVPAAVSAAVVGTTLASGLSWARLSAAERTSLLAAAAIAALVSGPILATYHLTLLIPPVAWALDAHLRTGSRSRALLIALAAVAAVWVPIPPPPSSVGPSSIVTLLPRFWACAGLWALLLPPRLTRWHLAVPLLVGVAVLRASPAPGAAGAQNLSGGQQPLIAAELVWSPADGLCWSGLASDRGDAPGRGWVGYCLGEDDVPRLVAADASAHTWAPVVEDGALRWRHAPIAPEAEAMVPIGGRGQVEVRLVDGQRELFWAPRDGPARRLTDHPADDRQPVWDPRRERLWFLSDRLAGVRAHRLWWLPPPWEARGAHAPHSP